MLDAGVPALVLRKPGKQQDRGLARNGKEGCHRQGARALSGLSQTGVPAGPWPCLLQDPDPDLVPSSVSPRPVFSE